MLPTRLRRREVAAGLLFEVAKVTPAVSTRAQSVQVQSAIWCGCCVGRSAGARRLRCP